MKFNVKIIFTKSCQNGLQEQGITDDFCSLLPSYLLCINYGSYLLRVFKGIHIVGDNMVKGQVGQPTEKVQKQHQGNFFEVKPIYAECI